MEFLERPGDNMQNGQSTNHEAEGRTERQVPTDMQETRQKHRQQQPEDNQEGCRLFARGKGIPLVLHRGGECTQRIPERLLFGELA